jgi:hypothetical protein
MADRDKNIILVVTRNFEKSLNMTVNDMHDDDTLACVLIFGFHP